MSRWLSIVLFAGCSCGSTPPADAPASTDVRAPVAVAPAPAAKGREAMIAALAVRDPEPSCEAVELLVDDPAAELIAVIDEVQMPPWVPMRAADCALARHGAQVGDRAVRWVSEPEYEGLGILVINHLDDLPEPLAVDAVAAALRGPRAEHVRRIAGHSRHGAVRALAPR